MVAGHLREKSGYYYAVLNYTDSLGKRKTKWISTGLTVKGNKKRAEAILMDARRNFNPEEPKVMNGDILFADYMEKWLDIIKSSVAVPTFASYSTTIKRIVAPYFREKEVTLKNLTAKDIQEFYMKELQRVSASSVIHYHANIHKALKYAVKIDLIDVNPADKVERPKKTATSAASMMPMRSTLFSRLQKEANLSFRFCSVRSTVYAGAKQSV